MTYILHKFCNPKTKLDENEHEMPKMRSSKEFAFDFKEDFKLDQ